MKTMILMLAMLITGCLTQEEQTAMKEQHTTPCVLPESQAGTDIDPSVTCNQVDYVQYTADFVTSAGVSPTPPITCTWHNGYRQPDGTWVPSATECLTQNFWSYGPYGDQWIPWMIDCLIWDAPDNLHTNNCNWYPGI